ncbi:MAG: FAD binding domain-containing protein, partial [Actinomycetota bacterium]
MRRTASEWLEPRSLEEALALRAEHGDEATVVAGGTFLGILMNQSFLAPTRLLALRSVPELAGVESDGDLRLGAMATHRRVEHASEVREGWPALARAFSVVASPRVRNQATVGGVMADADYASDPPAMLVALGARVVARSVSGERGIPAEDFILDHYTTALREDELVTEVRVPRGTERAVYRKFRSRSGEDRPCVSVAAALMDGRLRVVVGAVAGRPQHFPEVCGLYEGGNMSR